MPVVSGLDAARGALRTGADVLESPPWAACHSGVNYWHHLVETLRAEFPGNWQFILCCGEDAAIAHDALRMGFTHIRLQCSDSMFTQLSDIAALTGARIMRQPSPSKE